MKTIILQSCLKALCASLMLAIVGVGVLAVHMSHVRVQVSFAFGSPITETKTAEAKEAEIKLAAISKAIPMTALREHK